LNPFATWKKGRSKEKGARGCSVAIIQWSFNLDACTGNHKQALDDATTRKSNGKGFGLQMIKLEH